jgi:hypothetical protein
MVLADRAFGTRLAENALLYVLAKARTERVERRTDWAVICNDPAATIARPHS